MYDDTNVYESKLAVQSLQHNCGITEIILQGNTVDEDLKLQFDEELEKVRVLFPKAADALAHPFPACPRNGLVEAFAGFNAFACQLIAGA